MSDPTSDPGLPVPDLGRKTPSARVTRNIRLAVAIVASIASFFLARPYFRDYGYWAESRTMWIIYFVIGFVLAVYVFVAFLRSLRTLFEHDAIERAEAAELARKEAAGKGGRA